MEKITFQAADGSESTELYIIEETMIGGKKYILATEEETGDSEAYIFCDVSEDEENITYEPVENEEEFLSIAKVFEELLDDTAFETE